MAPYILWKKITTVLSDVVFFWITLPLQRTNFNALLMFKWEKYEQPISPMLQQPALSDDYEGKS